MNTYDVIVVGAGITGACAARALADAGRSVLVIDKRAHIGGNCYDCQDEHGVLIHPYGPHIFHTSKHEISTFLSRFTSWRPYEHTVMGLVNKRLIPLPFNLTSLAICFGKRAKSLEELLIQNFGAGNSIPILELRNSGHTELTELADFIYEHVFLGYTRKQWGLSPEELSPEVTNRVPIRLNHDDRYFTDSFQCMPEHGFSVMFENMLAHPNIVVQLNTEYTELGDAQGRPITGTTWKHCLYTGPIDAFFSCHAGALPYRSLNFTFEHYPQKSHLPAPVLNYPEFATPWTRISEYTKLTGQNHPATSVSVEYALAHTPHETEPYYPVVTEQSAELLQRYKQEADALSHLSFAGRLGDFRYYNMDDAALAGLTQAQAILQKLRTA